MTVIVPLPEFVVERAEALRGAGLSWAGVAREVGFTEHRVRKSVEMGPEARQHFRSAAEGKVRERAFDAEAEREAAGWRRGRAPAKPVPRERILELHGRRRRITEIAALVRVPYRDVIAVIEAAPAAGGGA